MKRCPYHCRPPQRKQQYPFLPWLVLLGIIFLTVAASNASGQGPGRMQDELDRTDELIERARDAVRESGSEKGKVLLTLAERHQENARMKFRQGQSAQAGDFTKKAREKALEAIAATRTPEENVEAVRRQLERTDDLLDAIRDKVVAGVASGAVKRPGLASTMIESLDRRQQTAWQHFREHRLRAALKLTVQVRDQAKRLAEKAHKLAHRPDNIEQTLDRTRDYLERVRDIVDQTGNSKGDDLLGRAEKRFRQAENAVGQGQLSVAREHLNVCRILLDRALGGIDRTADREQTQTLIERARLRWESMEGQVIESGSRHLLTLHQQAREELNRAESLLEDRKIVEALAHVRVAVRLLEQIGVELP